MTVSYVSQNGIQQTKFLQETKSAEANTYKVRLKLVQATRIDCIVAIGAIIPRKFMVVHYHHIVSLFLTILRKG